MTLMQPQEDITGRVAAALGEEFLDEHACFTSSRAVERREGAPDRESIPDTRIQPHPCFCCCSTENHAYVMLWPIANNSTSAWYEDDYGDESAGDDHCFHCRDVCCHMLRRPHRCEPGGSDGCHDGYDGCGCVQNDNDDHRRHCCCLLLLLSRQCCFVLLPALDGPTSGAGETHKP